jgi:hypothetical protein
MTQLPARGVVRVFRLTNEPGGLGLSCTPTGVSLAGVPLLRKTRAGFAPRPASEIAALLKAAYREDPTALQSRLDAIAQALNSGDFAKAMITAVHARAPELTAEAALRLVKADRELTKYNYNPDEPRDWHGRWTRDGSANPESVLTPEIESDQHAKPHISDQWLHVAENTSATATDAEGPSDGDHGDVAEEPASLEQTLNASTTTWGRSILPRRSFSSAIGWGDKARTSRQPNWRMRMRNISFFRSASLTGSEQTTQ